MNSKVILPLQNGIRPVEIEVNEITRYTSIIEIMVSITNNSAKPFCISIPLELKEILTSSGYEGIEITYSTMDALNCLINTSKKRRFKIVYFDPLNKEKMAVHLNKKKFVEKVEAYTLSTINTALLNHELYNTLTLK